MYNLKKDVEKWIFKRRVTFEDVEFLVTKNDILELLLVNFKDREDVINYIDTLKIEDLSDESYKFKVLQKGLEVLQRYLRRLS